MRSGQSADIKALNDPDYVWPTVIIGAGQAGLSAAHTLIRKGFSPGTDFVVLDAEDGPGGAWRHRWDSLTLGKTHRIYDLPGHPLKEAPGNIPAREVVKDYYGQYETKFSLPVVRPARVLAVDSTSLEADPLSVDGSDFATTLLAVTHSVRGKRPRTLLARTIISSTGNWTRPFVPYIPGMESFGGRSLHTVDYESPEDLEGKKVVVVGGGLSAVQFILELEGVTETVWSTRRPPNFSAKAFDEIWGAEVEAAVNERTLAGKRPASVVRTTGIPMIGPYLAGVKRGALVSRGMIDRIRPGHVRFKGSQVDAGTRSDPSAEGLGPSAREDLALPQSWQPFHEPTWVDADVIFWNTGFRAETRHLRPLKLRSPEGGMVIEDRVKIAADPRVYVAGYGSGASTFGATRTGRAAANAVAERLGR